MSKLDTNNLVLDINNLIVTSDNVHFWYLKTIGRVISDFNNLILDIKN